jgi:hypothetical protein
LAEKLAQKTESSINQALANEEKNIKSKENIQRLLKNTESKINKSFGTY